MPNFPGLQHSNEVPKQPKDYHQTDLNSFKNSYAQGLNLSVGVCWTGPVAEMGRSMRAGHAKDGKKGRGGRIGSCLESEICLPAANLSEKRCLDGHNFEFLSTAIPNNQQKPF